MRDRLESTRPPGLVRLRTHLAAVVALCALAAAPLAAQPEAPSDPGILGIQQATPHPPRDDAPLPPDTIAAPRRGDVDTGMRRYVEIRSLVILHDQCGFLGDYTERVSQAFDRAVRDSVIALRMVLPYYDRQALNEIIHRETLAAYGDCGPTARAYFSTRLDLVRDWN